MAVGALTLNHAVLPLKPSSYGTLAKQPSLDNRVAIYLQQYQNYTVVLLTQI